MIRDFEIFFAIMFFMATDCVVYLSNFTRFVFPTFVASNTAYNYYLTYKSPLIFSSETVVSFDKGSINLTDIRQFCLLNIFLYCLTGVTAIFQDWQHKYFILLHARYRREKIFKLSNRRKEWFYEKQYHQFSGLLNAWKCVCCIENWNTLCVSKWNEFWVIFMAFWIEILYLELNTNVYMRVFLATIS